MFPQITQNKMEKLETKLDTIVDAGGKTDVFCGRNQPKCSHFLDRILSFKDQYLAATKGGDRKDVATIIYKILTTEKFRFLEVAKDGGGYKEMSSTCAIDYVQKRMRRLLREDTACCVAQSPDAPPAKGIVCTRLHEPKGHLPNRIFRRHIFIAAGTTKGRVRNKIASEIMEDLRKNKFIFVKKDNNHWREMESKEIMSEICLRLRRSMANSRRKKPIKIAKTVGNYLRSVQDTEMNSTHVANADPQARGQVENAGANIRQRRNRRTAANKHTFPDCSADLWQKCSSPCDSCRKIFSHIAPHELYNDNSDIHGTGLFARCPILEGTMIAEFVGKKSDPETISNGFVLQLQEKWITPLGTHRFVNHSCEPNAMFQKWSDEKGDEKVSICALTDIPENAEVCVSYGREHHLSIGEMRCTCRSTQCVSQGFNKPIP